MISTKGRYALRVMIDLAQQDPERYIPLKDIAQRQMISEKYLEIILKSLVQSKLLKGLRGKGGGYKLTRVPSAYTALEIIETAEGSLAPVSCLASGADPCERRSVCKTLPMWTRYDSLVRDFFSSISLQDLVDEEPLPAEDDVTYGAYI